MPRKYSRKTLRASYSKETLETAIQKIKNKELSYNGASSLYGIPKSTLSDRVLKKRGLLSNKLGRATAIPIEFEKQLADDLRKMERDGMSLSRKQVLDVTQNFIKRNNLEVPFKNGRPGPDWFLSFRQRHLSFKEPEALKQLCLDKITILNELKQEPVSQKQDAVLAKAGPSGLQEKKLKKEKANVAPILTNVTNMDVEPTISEPLIEIKVEPEVSACRACLATDARLYDVTECGLQEAFFELTSIPVSTLDEVRHLCIFCCSELSKYAAFRDRCQRVHELLATLQEWGPLKMDDIRTIDRDSHKLTRNLAPTEVEIIVSNDTNEAESLFSTPIKTEEDDNNDSVLDTNYEEPEYETMSIEIELIKDSEMKEEVKQINGTLGSSEASTKVTEIDTGNTEDIEKKEKKPTALKKRKTLGGSEVSTKVTKIDTDNTEDIEKQETQPTALKNLKSSHTKSSKPKRKKRIKICDEFYPDFDYKAFET